MDWSKTTDLPKTIQDHLQQLKPIEVNEALFQRVVKLIDLTSLNDSDTESSIGFFCEKARTPYGDVAAVCVYPKFVRMVASTFAGSPIKTDSVANFPEGNEELEKVLIEIDDVLTDGAQEVDLVFPYTRFLEHEVDETRQFVAACKAACGSKKLLKVIIETGSLGNMENIQAATINALEGGADFIKTSTGKTAQGATLSSAAAVLLTLKAFNEEHDESRGFKVSGGIKDVMQAGQYIQLADNIMGREWVRKENFRIGSSKLVDSFG